MTEIDRLAAAYCDSFIGKRWRRIAPGEYERDDTPFADLAGDDQELIKEGVRAILTAMRRPHEKATLAGLQEIPFGPSSLSTAKRCWRAMIDHILSEGA